MTPSSLLLHSAMPFDIDIKLEAIIPPQETLDALSTDVLHLCWKASRRVFQRTLHGFLPQGEDESVGPPAFASFDINFGQVSDLHPQIRHSLSSMNLAPWVTNAVCPRITAFANGLAARRSPPTSPFFIVFANLNLVQKIYVDSIQDRLETSDLVDESFFLVTSQEESDGSDDEEGEEGDSEGASDSAIAMLRTQNFERRGGEEESCSVCLETFWDGEEVIPLRCQHVYHESCILTWLKNSRSCPLCRGQQL